MIWFILLVLAALAAVAPFAIESRRALPPKTLPAGDTGHFAELPQGRTYYEWNGPVDGPICVCIHGLSTPSFVWSTMMRGLTTMGYRVLSYDLYGRGLSARPKGPQDRAFFLEQLKALLDHQKVDEFTLIGFSMGGAIATAFAAQDAERVERLILIAPAGFGINLAPVEKMVRDRPGLGDWLMLGFGGKMLRQRTEVLANGPDPLPKIAELQAAETTKRGFLPAILSSQRHMLREKLDADMAEIKRIYVPTLAIWGQEDRIIPARAIGQLTQANRDARHATIDGASHWMPLTHPREVLHAIQEFRRET